MSQKYQHKQLKTDNLAEEAADRTEGEHRKDCSHEAFQKTRHPRHPRRKQSKQT
jgi:hypothetical protein